MKLFSIYIHHPGRGVVRERGCRPVVVLNFDIDIVDGIIYTQFADMRTLTPLNQEDSMGEIHLSCV